MRGDKRSAEFDEAAEGAAASLLVCRSCPVGAIHAGAVPITVSGLYGSSICPRCRKGATRMIGNRICVGCYNREREYLSGRNARGNAPVRARPLGAVDVRLMVDDVVEVRRFEGVVDGLEVQLQTLRTRKGRAEWSFAGDVSDVRQQRFVFV